MHIGCEWGGLVPNILLKMHPPQETNATKEGPTSITTHKGSALALS